MANWFNRFCQRFGTDEPLYAIGETIILLEQSIKPTKSYFHKKKSVKLIESDLIKDQPILFARVVFICKKRNLLLVEITYKLRSWDLNKSTVLT